MAVRTARGTDDQALADLHNAGTVTLKEEWPSPEAITTLNRADASKMRTQDTTLVFEDVNGLQGLLLYRPGTLQLESIETRGSECTLLVVRPAIGLPLFTQVTRELLSGWWEDVEGVWFGRTVNATRSRTLVTMFMANLAVAGGCRRTDVDDYTYWYGEPTASLGLVGRVTVR